MNTTTEAATERQISYINQILARQSWMGEVGTRCMMADTAERRSIATEYMNAAVARDIREFPEVAAENCKAAVKALRVAADGDADKFAAGLETVIEDYLWTLRDESARRVTIHAEGMTKAEASTYIAELLGERI